MDCRLKTLPDLVKTRSEQTPHGIATCHYKKGKGWMPTTWSEFWIQIEQTAVAFRKIGLQKQDRVAILIPSCREWEVLHMASLQIGAAVIGIDPRTLPQDIVFILEHSGANCMVLQNDGFLPKIPSAIIKSMKLILLLNGTSGSQGNDHCHIWQDFFRATNSRDHLPKGDQLSSDHLAAIIYTSGTTGVAKGICFTHGQLLKAAQSIVETLPAFLPGEKIICWLPLASLFQRVINLVAIQLGLTIYFVENPENIMQFIPMVEPSFFIAVPRFYEKLHLSLREQIAGQKGWKRKLTHLALEAGRERARSQFEKRNPPWHICFWHSVMDRLVLRRLRSVVGGNMRCMITGSAPISRGILEFFHSLGLVILEGYGVSENVIPMAMNRFHDFKFGTVGKPLPANEIKIAPDGEILVRGPGVFSGYYKDPNPEKSFIEENFHATGDIGHFDEEGFLTLTGRKSEILKTSTGRRISPVRIEAILNQSPWINQSMVVGNGRKYLVALLALNLPAIHQRLVQAGIPRPPDEKLAELSFVNENIQSEIQRLNQSLPDYEQLGGFIILSEPFGVENGLLTSSLKLRRNCIGQRYQHLIDHSYEEASGPALFRQSKGDRKR